MEKEDTTELFKELNEIIHDKAWPRDYTQLLYFYCHTDDFFPCKSKHVETSVEWLHKNQTLRIQWSQGSRAMDQSFQINAAWLPYDKCVHFTLCLPTYYKYLGLHVWSLSKSHYYWKYSNSAGSILVAVEQ